MTVELLSVNFLEGFVIVQLSWANTVNHPLHDIHIHSTDSYLVANHKLFWPGERLDLQWDVVHASGCFNIKSNGMNSKESNTLTL